MRKLRATLASITSSMFLVIGMPLTAGAAPVYSLFGDASLVSPGHASDTAVQLVSDVEGEEAEGFAGIDFEVEENITWSELTNLNTDYDITDDDCGGGSPRFQLNVDTDDDGISDGNVHVVIGLSPNFTDCTTGWQNTGNLIGNEDAGRYDFSQFGGSTFTTYSDAPQSVMDGDVVGVQLVADGGWSEQAANGDDGEQTVLADNVVINAHTFTFETEEEPEMPTTKDDCKKGGWEAYSVFKNQGDCVSWVATQGRNQPALANNPTF